jgi:glycosyltransferase involved in cell wall biosynthesis
MLNKTIVGYIGVDVLNNATVCNEAVGLIQDGVPLDVVSVYHFDRPTYYQDQTLAELFGRIHALYPLGWLATAWALVCAPWLFGARFWTTLIKMITCPTEGWRQRLRFTWHLVPAICLATHWRKKGIGHIHAHWAHTATTIAMHAAELLGVGFSFTGHANDLFVHRVALTAKVRRARFIVCISEYHRRFYLALGADPARLQVVYCGIDTARFQPAREGPEIEGPLRPRILAVGRLVEKKGFHHLIKACAALRNRGLDYDCLIAGSGPEETSLRRLVELHGLADCVTITGQPVLQEDLQPLLCSATVFALPCVKDRDGDMDGLPQVLIEAMACGVPAVSTRLVGNPDLIRDDWNGLLVSPGDTTALASALERIILSPQWASELGACATGWARLRHLFDWSVNVPGRTAPPYQWQSAPAIVDDSLVLIPSLIA